MSLPGCPPFSVARDPLDRPQQPDLLRIDRDQARPFRCGFEPSVRHVITQSRRWTDAFAVEQENTTCEGGGAKVKTPTKKFDHGLFLCTHCFGRVDRRGSKACPFPSRGPCRSHSGTARRCPWTPVSRSVSSKLTHSSSQRIPGTKWIKKRNCRVPYTRAHLCAVVDELVSPAEEVRGAAEEVGEAPEELGLGDADQEDGDRQGERDERPHDVGGCGCCGAGALVGPVSLSERLVRPSRLWGNPYFRGQGAALAMATRRPLSVCPHATDAATHSLSLSVAPSRSIYVHSIHPESMQCPMVNTGQTSEAQPPLLLYPLRVNTTSVASSPLLPRSLASVASASHLASSHLNTAHAGRSYLCVCTLRTGRNEMVDSFHASKMTVSTCTVQYDYMWCGTII